MLVSLVTQNAKKTAISALKEMELFIYGHNHLFQIAPK